MLKIENIPDSNLRSVCTSVKWRLKWKAYGTRKDGNATTGVSCFRLYAGFHCIGQFKFNSVP
jgi:hypothetical protein